MPDSLYLADLVNANLVGGTLVEYAEGCRFGVEFGRGIILKVERREDGAFVIETDDSEKACLCLHTGIDVIPVDLHEGIYRWSTPVGWCYAAAPIGVAIPHPDIVPGPWDRGIL
jgi:hypothetical protein